jgi:hypothetical protein
LRPTLGAAAAAAEAAQTTTTTMMTMTTTTTTTTPETMLAVLPDWAEAPARCAPGMAASARLPPLTRACCRLARAELQPLCVCTLCFWTRRLLPPRRVPKQLPPLPHRLLAVAAVVRFRSPLQRPQLQVYL